MIPPSILRIYVNTNPKHIRLWIPLFLLWPLIILAVILAPLAMICVCLHCKTYKIARSMMAGPRFWSVFCALRGFHVQVNEPGTSVEVRIF